MKGKVMIDKPLRDLTDEELKAELEEWETKISVATSWGAAVGAAHEFAEDCRHESRRRIEARKENA